VHTPPVPPTPVPPTPVPPTPTPPQEAAGGALQAATDELAQLGRAEPAPEHPQPLAAPPPNPFAPPAHVVAAPPPGPFAPAPPTTSPQQPYAPPTTPPQQPYAPPTQAFTAPTQAFAPPSQAFAPPSQASAPPAQTFAPPSQKFAPPTQTFAPPQPFAAPAPPPGPRIPPGPQVQAGPRVQAGPQSQPVAPARRTPVGRLVLAACLTSALLVAAFVVVMVARPDHPGTAAAVTAAGSATPGDHNAGEAGGAALATSPSPVSPSPGRSSAAATATPRGSAPAVRATAAPTSDEFTSAKLNTSMWSVYGGDSKYSASMVRVASGELQVLGVGKNPTAAANQAGGLCWCGANGNQVYGKWQVRARFDAGAGYRAELVLWPKGDDAAANGSVTFATDSDAARTTVWGVLNPPGGGSGNDRGKLTGDFTAWHVYTVDWRATYVKISVDGKLIYDSTTDPARPAIPSKPMHLVVQVDKGPTADIPAANASTPAQVIEHIDWVHFSH
jgi:hypothetical protein